MTTQKLESLIDDAFAINGLARVILERAEGEDDRKVTVQAFLNGAWMPILVLQGLSWKEAFSSTENRLRQTRPSKKKAV